MGFPPETAIKKKPAAPAPLAPSAPAPAAPRNHAPRQQLSGHHAHALTGAMYSYHGDYGTLGTMVDWTAQVDAGNGELPPIAGSIRLSRGQTQGMAPRLVMHMISACIDQLQARDVVPA